MSLAGNKGNLTYMGLASTGGMWLLSMQGVYVGSSTAATSYCSSADCAVLLDTGTSFIGMPSAAFLDFAARVQAARSDCLVDSASGLIRCDQNTPSGLPSLSFSIQGNLFTLQPSDYFQQGVLGLMVRTHLAMQRGNCPRSVFVEFLFLFCSLCVFSFVVLLSCCRASTWAARLLFGFLATPS